MPHECSEHAEFELVRPMLAVCDLNSGTTSTNAFVSVCSLKDRSREGRAPTPAAVFVRIRFKFGVMRQTQADICLLGRLL